MKVVNREYYDPVPQKAEESISTANRFRSVFQSCTSLYCKKLMNKMLEHGIKHKIGVHEIGTNSMFSTSNCFLPFLPIL